MNRKSTHRTNHFEPLESRQLRAGNPLIITGTENPDVISVSYTQIASGVVYHIWVNGELSEPYNPGYTDIIIEGRGGGDNIELEDLKLGVRAQISGGSGNDVITFGDGRWSNFVVDGSVLVDTGTGNDTINFDDHDNTTNAFDDRYVLTSNSFKWGGYNSGGALFFASPTTFYNAETINIRCNNGPSTIEVQGVLEGVHVGIQGGSGANEFRVASGDMDTQLKGTLTTFGEGGSDTAVFFDQDDTGADTYTINSNSILKNSGMGAITYFGLEKVTLWGNNQNDAFVINGTHQGTSSLEIRGNGGNDTFNVGGGNLVNAVRGKLILKGDTGTNTVELRDQANTAAGAITITDTSATKSNFVNKLTYSNMQTVRLSGGSGADQAIVRPSALSEFIVAGNASPAGAVDSLSLDLAGATGVTRQTIGAGSGLYKFYNRKQVQYAGFETSTYAPPPSLSLSDTSWSSATNGWGPVEFNKSNGEQAAGDGHVLTLNGQTYSKGLGVHAGSEIVYQLGSVGWDRFVADVGIDDEVGANGSAVFQVWADGAKLFDSGVMTGNSATQHVDVNIAGKSQLRLIVTDGGNGSSFDHANWAAAQLLDSQIVISTPIFSASSLATKSSGPRLVADLFGSTLIV